MLPLFPQTPVVADAPAIPPLRSTDDTIRHRLQFRENCGTSSSAYSFDGDLHRQQTHAQPLFTSACAAFATCGSDCFAPLRPTASAPAHCAPGVLHIPASPAAARAVAAGNRQRQSLFQKLSWLASRRLLKAAKSTGWVCPARSSRFRTRIRSRRKFQYRNRIAMTATTATSVIKPLLQL